eukprot:3232900-Amphidinium_carterae.1
MKGMSSRPIHVADKLLEHGLTHNNPIWFQDMLTDDTASCSLQLVCAASRDFKAVTSCDMAAPSLTLSGLPMDTQSC